MTSIACPNCQAKIKLKPKASNSSSPSKSPTPNVESPSPVSPAEDLQEESNPQSVIVAPIASTFKGALLTPTPDSNETMAPDIPPETPIAQLVPEVDLLPPKFIVDEASRGVVVLPSADGGTQLIDPNVIHVRHGDKTVSLKALTPEQRARRKMIQNFVILLLAALMLAAAIWILL